MAQRFAPQPYGPGVMVHTHSVIPARHTVEVTRVHKRWVSRCLTCEQGAVAKVLSEAIASIPHLNKLQLNQLRSTFRHREHERF